MFSRFILSTNLRKVVPTIFSGYANSFSFGRGSYLQQSYSSHSTTFSYKSTYTSQSTQYREHSSKSSFSGSESLNSISNNSFQTISSVYSESFENSVSYKLLQELSTFIFEINSSERTNFFAIFKSCMSGFYSRDSGTYELAMKGFYDGFKKIGENASYNWDDNVLKSTIISSLMNQQISGSNLQTSCGEYLESKLKSVSSLEVRTLYIKYFGEANVISFEKTKINEVKPTIKSKAPFITSMFNQHRETLTPGSFTRINIESRS